MSTHSLLTANGILRSLSVDELARLSSDCRWRTVEREREIVGVGVASTDVHFIARGRVRITIYSEAGREVAFRELAPGDSFGQLAAIDGNARSATVMALDATTLGSITRDRFFRLMREHPDVGLDVMRDLTALIRDLTSRIVDGTTLTVPVRVRRELFRLANEGTVSGNRATVAAAPTHADLANRIGATREAVTRELNRLDRIGLIRREGRSLTILDLAALDTAAHSGGDD
jgi:CRP-like cAMP-binding protein